MHLLFVYGSLKRGFSNHFFLHGAEWVGEALTEPHYKMFDYGGYPAAIPANDGGYSIEGEVWRINDAHLFQTDLLEAVEEGLYERSTARLLPPWEELENVIMYHYLRDTTGLPDVGGTWPKSRDKGNLG